MVKTQDTFKKDLQISLFIHLFILMIFSVRAIFFDSSSMVLERSVRVDLVALPDKIINEPMAATPEKAPAEPKPAEPVKPAEPKVATPSKPVNDAIKLEKSEKPKDKQKAALDKLRQMDALEKIQKDLQEENQKKALEKLKKPSFKGNALAPGTSLTGLNRLQHQEYLAAADEHVRRLWFLPEYLRHRQLTSSILIKIDENGQIIFKGVYKTSGVAAFDDLALETVQKSAPLPPPPDKFMRILSVQGFVINFRE